MADVEKDMRTGLRDFRKHIVQEPFRVSLYHFPKSTTPFKVFIENGKYADDYCRVDISFPVRYSPADVLRSVAKAITDVFVKGGGCSWEFELSGALQMGQDDGRDLIQAIMNIVNDLKRKTRLTGMVIQACSLVRHYPDLVPRLLVGNNTLTSLRFPAIMIPFLTLERSTPCPIHVRPMEANKTTLESFAAFAAAARLTRVTLRDWPQYDCFNDPPLQGMPDLQDIEVPSLCPIDHTDAWGCLLDHTDAVVAASPNLKVLRTSNLHVHHLVAATALGGDLARELAEYLL
jgi:hypothetical protein